MKPLRPGDLTNSLPVDGRGRRSPTDIIARTARDHLLRTARHRYCAAMSDRAAAVYLRTKLARYRECAWERDRVEERCPDRHRGRLNELLWQVLMARDMIPGDRTIRAALALDPFFIAHDQ